MTDGEIIKALECCCSIGDSCKECPMYVIGGANCNPGILAQYLCNIINEQRAEIEGLTKILDIRCDKCPTTARYLHSNKLLEKDVADARAELKKFKTMYVDKVAMMGAKAFAEKLCEDRVSNDPVVIAVRSELKKEME